MKHLKQLLCVVLCLFGVAMHGAAGAVQPQTDVIALAAMGFTPMLPSVERQTLDVTPAQTETLENVIADTTAFRRTERERILSLFAADAPALPKLDPKELKCLSQAMFYEARGEGEQGMVSVAYVIKNRKADDRFPKTICGVVHQASFVKRIGRVVCQFSYTCDGIPDRVRPRDKHIYERAQELAEQVLYDQIVNPVRSALFFHATHVRPKWAKSFERIARVGRHIFYTHS